MSNKTNTSGEIGFFGMLGILFIGLKLAEVIDWSWWYVLLPLYFPLAIVLVVVVACGLLVLGESIFKRK